MIVDDSPRPWRSWSTCRLVQDRAVGDALGGWDQRHFVFFAADLASLNVLMSLPIGIRNQPRTRAPVLFQSLLEIQPSFSHSLWMQIKNNLCVHFCFKFFQHQTLLRPFTGLSIGLKGSGCCFSRLTAFRTEKRTDQLKKKILFQISNNFSSLGFMSK